MLSSTFKSLTYRAMSVLLSVIMLFSVFDFSILTTTAAATDGGFEISLKWNGTDQDPTTFEYISDCDESRLVRLKVSYKNKEVTSGYQPGEIVITVPGIKDAVRSGASYRPAAVAADKASSTTKSYDWSYTYSSTSDTFTFTNNVTIEANSTFDGSFEIIWNLPSRETKNDFSTTLQAKLRTAENEQALSNEIYYSQTRTGDEYKLEIKPSALSSPDGLASILPTGKIISEYTWVKYDIYGTNTYNARGVQGSERFDCWFLADALVQGAGLTDTGKTMEKDGLTYKCWSVSKDITNLDTLYLKDIYVAYPKDPYENEVVSAYVDLMGTYYDDTEETTLCEAPITINLIDFGFIDLPGNLYDVSKYSYGVHSKYIDEHCETCRDYGAVNSLDLLNGSVEYYSCLSLYLNYTNTTIYQSSSYDLEFVDDIMDVQTTDGNLRRLEDDEYHFTRVVIPPTSDVKNANGFEIQADTYLVEIYVRKADAGATEFEKIDGTYYITDSKQSIDLPDNTVAVKVKVNDIQESISTLAPLNIGLYYKFHTTADDIVVDSGNIINYMYFNIYNAENQLFNLNYGEDTYPSKEIYDRDISLYGESFDREMSTLHIIEVPNNLTSTTSIKKTSDNEEAYYFTGSIEDSFTIAEGNSLSEFSTYTILPEDIELQPLYDDEVALLDYLTFNSDNYSDWYIKEHVEELEINTNYKESGRTYIAIHYNFSDAPITLSTKISVSNIPMYYERDKITDASKVFTLRSITLIDQAGKWYASSIDNNSAEDSIWKDIDGDDNTSEPAAYSYCHVTVYNPQSTNLQFTKSVKTILTNGYVQPSKDKDSNSYVKDEIPYTYKNTEYSYKLRLQTSNGCANNIVFVDVLETGSNAEWQGTFVRVDTSYAEKLLNAKPTVYYSSTAVDLAQKLDLKSDTWTTAQPTVVKSIAVDFGNAMLPSDSSLYIEIYMKSPDDDITNKDKLTENFSYVYYDAYDTNGTLSEDDENLPSNNVPVSITPFMGTIKLVKRDSVNLERLSGAEFKLYKMSGATPNTSSDTLIDTLTTNSSGIASIKLFYGNYYVVETKAPNGYELDTTPITIELDSDKPELTVTKYIENERIPGQFTLQKLSDRNSSVYLEGATFTLYTKDDAVVQKNLTTDESGKITVTNLDWGDYYLKETKAPDGYLLSDEKISFTINAEDIKPALTVENEQIPASVILVKTEILENGSTTTNPVDGAVYKLYDSSNNTLGSYITDDEGKIYVDDLTFGDYYFEESIAAQGYELNTARIAFTLDGNDLQTDNTVSETITTADNRKLGNLWLQKTDDVGDYVQNAVFALYNSNNVQVDATGQASNVTFTTDAQGIIEIENMYWGDYYLKEIKAPTGYELSGNVYSVTVGEDTVNQTIIINATNNRKKGSVELTKVSESDNTPLKDAVYTLYKSDGTVYRDDLKTNDNGIIKVENIEWGSYYFLEKTAPNGYGLSDEKIRFSVNNLTAGKVQTLTATDPVIAGQIEVVKRIKISDIVYAHGDPTFIFKLAGTDSNQKTYTYYKNVVFNENFVDLYEDAHSNATYVEQSVVFTDVPVGTWTVSEVDTVNYTLDTVEAETSNGSESGNTVVFTLTEDNSDGKAVFTNSKKAQTSTTHTSLAVNIAKVGRKLTAIVALWKGEDTITSETLDRTKLDVYAVYDDGAQVKLADDAYTLDPETFNQAMNGEYTVKVEYTEDGRTCTDSFELGLNIPSTFTWTVAENTFTEDGVTYDGYGYDYRLHR